MAEITDIQVVLVDENNKELGTMEKIEAHKKGLLHRAVSVFIFNSKGEWLLQQRALHKYHSKGLWSNTSCTHPYPDETSKHAAERRLYEEMGLDVSLEEIFSFTYKIELENGMIEHELDHVFVGFSDNIPLINREEVESWKYLLVEDLKKDLIQNPDKYSFWFREIFDKVQRKLLSVKSCI